MLTTPPSCRQCAYNTGCCTKERLLTVCVRLLLSCGNEPVTTRRLADEAEVNHALITYHFGSMSQLIDTAVQQIESRIQVELAPEVHHFTVSLTKAAPHNLRVAFKDACTQLVEFMLTRAPQMYYSRCLFKHKSCVHRLYPLYENFIVKPLLESFEICIETQWKRAKREYTTLDVFLQANTLLSQILLSVNVASNSALSSYGAQDFSSAKAQQKAVQEIVRSVLYSWENFEVIYENLPNN